MAAEWCSVMDERLLAWGRAVKARRGRGRQFDGAAVPPLWLFTDWDRLLDPTRVVRRLPGGLCGVVYRPGLGAGAGELRRLRQLCRARRILLSVAGALGAAGCGEHRPGGRRSLRRARAAFVTASAHGVAELVRAERSGGGAGVPVAGVRDCESPRRQGAGAAALGGAGAGAPPADAGARRD